MTKIKPYRNKLSSAHIGALSEIMGVVWIDWVDELGLGGQIRSGGAIEIRG